MTPEFEPVAYTTMPEADDWLFVSGSKDPNGKLEGKFNPLFDESQIKLAYNKGRYDAIKTLIGGKPFISRGEEMSMHKIPLTKMEEAGLVAHGLPVNTPSQLSDAFRQGIAWAKPEIKLTEMKESNGRVTWTVYIALQGQSMPWDWLPIYSDSIKGRAEYEASRAKYFFGLGPEPDILAFDTDLKEDQNETKETPAV